MMLILFRSDVVPFRPAPLRQFVACAATTRAWKSQTAQTSEWLKSVEQPLQGMADITTWLGRWGGVLAGGRL